MLWVDKYRPRTLDKVMVHKEEATNLKNLVSVVYLVWKLGCERGLDWCQGEHVFSPWSWCGDYFGVQIAQGDCPHLLFYGPSGAGKKTLIMALLREMFGSSAEKVHIVRIWGHWSWSRSFSFRFVKRLNFWLPSTLFSSFHIIAFRFNVEIVLVLVVIFELEAGFRVLQRGPGNKLNALQGLIYLFLRWWCNCMELQVKVENKPWKVEVIDHTLVLRAVELLGMLWRILNLLLHIFQWILRLVWLNMYRVRIEMQAGTRKIEVELTTVSSNHHVELNPSDAGFQDRYVVQEIIKDMAKNRPLDVAGNRGFKGTFLFTNSTSHSWPFCLICMLNICW